MKFRVRGVDVAHVRVYRWFVVISVRA